jgi:hypothetical protein
MEEEKTQINNQKDAKVLRTYTSDMAEAIRTNEMSVIKIALAEKEKREREESLQKAEGTNTTKILFLILLENGINNFLLQKRKDKKQRC